jgi:hypothetical protein
VLKAGRLQVPGPKRSMNLFSIYLILPFTLDTGVYSFSDKNEYQDKKNVSWE